MTAQPFSATDYPPDATLYVFDFCGTLFNSNTTLDFIDWLAELKMLPAGQVLAGRLLAGVGRRTGMMSPAAHVRQRVRALRGLTEEEINVAARTFLAHRLASQRRPDQHAFLQWCIDQGKEVILLSFTLEALLSAFVDQAENEQGLRFFGSRLEVLPPGQLTGAYDLQMHTYGKLRRLSEEVPEEQIAGTCFLTDDAIADQDLLSKVKYPLLVTAS